MEGTQFINRYLSINEFIVAVIVLNRMNMLYLI